MDKTSDSLFVISEYALDSKPFDKGYKTNDWDKCSLKKWLNSTFFNKAFTSEEKSLIENTSYGKVFCLSIEEAMKYFSSNSDRKCEPTQYALRQIRQLPFASNGFMIWWLRSSGRSLHDAASVLPNGGICPGAIGVDEDSIAVRPAMKLRF